MKRLRFLVLLLPLVAHAAPPAALAQALEYLRDQHSYSWETINGDPGPVAQNLETRRGTVTTVQRSTFPHMKGSIDLAGNTWLRRDWSDGLQLDTLITAGGAMVTHTPEGWMTTQEILDAQAEERLRPDGPTARVVWLGRADRPSVMRPDQELISLLTVTNATFDEPESETFVVKAAGSAEGGAPEFAVTFTLHLHGGVIRDYELNLEGTRRISRSHVAVPISEHRLVILTYVPMAKVDAPPEAWEKLPATKTPR
ncbi:MAG TPA: hypothetical protein VHD62_01230 [Opitutaceae bacterium]|nr:hypothetical protein [Opitutaceae bacterium]